jgi:hypothetical protein
MVAFTVAWVLVGLATSSVAAADTMDPTPERLVTQPAGLPSGVTCQGVAANPEQVLHAPFPMTPGISPNQFACLPNNVAWANMMSELGMAIAPTAFHPARTTGLGGFALSLEATFTHINADATAGGLQYWHAGTQGPVDPNTNRSSIVNNSPDSLLQVYTLKARKGLAYGFEVTGALGYLANTSLWIGGGDLHWAALEGYRTGLLGYLPDIAIGGGVRTLGGSPKFFLTTIGIDGQISKPFVLADSAVLTPYLGVQRVIIFADSSVVNLAPNVDALQQCGYEGTNVPGNPNGSAPFNGKPICANKLSNGADNNSAFNDLTTFTRARIHRWRGIAGLNYRFEVLYLAAQFAMDVTDPDAENANLGITGAKQWTTSFEAGVYF